MLARIMGLHTVSPARVHELTRNGKSVAVVDVNAPERWMGGHVPGAINLDPTNIEDRALPKDKAAMLVFYCSGPLCMKAPRAARRAEQLGYQNVHVMAAGISGWEAARLPTEPGA